MRIADYFNTSLRALAKFAHSFFWPRGVIKMTKAKFQASSLTRYGDAGPGVQHSDTITMTELKELIKREKVRPDQLYTKEEILDDPKVKAHIELNIKKAEKIEADKLKEEDIMIPGDDKPTLTAEQKRQQKIDDEFIPNGKSDSEDSDLIPD